MKFLEGTHPLLPPVAARAMDAKNAPPVAWSDELDGAVRREYRTLKFGERGGRYRGWQFVLTPDRVWDDAERIEVASLRGPGGWAWKGNCNAFVPKLRDRLKPFIPDYALRLVVCRTGDGQGHMVLAIDTDRGPLICCQIQGCWPADDPAFKDYKWLHAETGGRAWVALRDFPTPPAPNLADMIDRLP